MPQTEGVAARRVATNARLPMSDWFAPGNPFVTCNDGLPSTSSVITAFLPKQVRPDYASSNQQTVWVQPEIYNLAYPNAPVESGQWFYTVLNNDQWTSNYWYLYQGLGTGPPGHLDDDVRPQPAGQLRGGLRHVVAGQRHRPVAVELAPGGLAPAGQRLSTPTAAPRRRRATSTTGPPPPQSFVPTTGATSTAPTTAPSSPATAHPSTTRRSRSGPVPEPHRRTDRSPVRAAVHPSSAASCREASSASKNAISCSGSGTVAASTLKPIRTVSA